MKRSKKIDAIDIMKLALDKDGQEKWIIFLTNCFEKRDLNKLAATRTRLQKGMSIAAKKKISTPAIDELFIRLQKSIEDTMRKIVRAYNPNPCDNPLLARYNLHLKGQKKIRDNSLERLLKKTGY